MPAHSEQQILPYTPSQLFDMVADVERYPEFLPWCKAARVLERKDGEILAELAIRFSHWSESYVSRVALARPEAIDVTMLRGPFEYLVNRWRFTPCGDGTQVDFFLDFKFRSRLLEKMIGAMLGKATEKMAGAFRARADALYGR